MRLKKGSAAAKAWGRKMARLRGSPKSKSKLKVSNVARKRRVSRRAPKRRSYKRSDSFNSTKAILGGLTYGAFRQKLSALAAPITAKIPGGVYADNLVMGGISYLMAKKGGKLPMGKYIKEAGKAGLYAESVLAGVDVGANIFPTVSASSW